MFVISLYWITENLTVEWPTEPEEVPPWEVQDLVHSLLKQNAAERLGSVQMGGKAAANTFSVMSTMFM